MAIVNDADLGPAVVPVGLKYTENPVAPNAPTVVLNVCVVVMIKSLGLAPANFNAEGVPVRFSVCNPLFCMLNVRVEVLSPIAAVPILNDPEDGISVAGGANDLTLISGAGNEYRRSSN